MEKLTSYIKLVFVVIATIICASSIFVILPFNYKKKAQTYVSKIWSFLVLKIIGVKVNLTGFENIDPKRSYIIAINHQSLLDTPPVILYIPQVIMFIYKKELAYIPFFGWAMMVMHISIDRSNQERARKSIQKASRKIKPGMSVVMYPEGTRSKDGSVGPFKSGAFIMAINLKLPILPVGITGSPEILPKNTLLLRKGTINIKMNPPVETENLTIDDKDILKENIHRIIKDSVNELESKG